MENIIQEKEQAQDELPIYIVQLTNCFVTVPIDEFNASFSKEHQMAHAATVAIETLLNKSNHENARLTMLPDSRNENPKCGTTVLVYLSGTDPEKAFPLLTHMAFADAGEYARADQMQKQFNQQFQEQKTKFAENEQKTAREAADLQRFAKSQKPAAVKKPTRKKK